TLNLQAGTYQIAVDYFNSGGPGVSAFTINGPAPVVWSGNNAYYTSIAASWSGSASYLTPAPGALYQSPQSVASIPTSVSMTSSPILFGAGTGGLASNVYIYWALGRAYPPGGVMPSVSIK
ncbi:MAG: hypothetical protein ACP5RJ_09220, partial [Conexivisphaera sp.]